MCPEECWKFLIWFPRACGKSSIFQKVTKALVLHTNPQLDVEVVVLATVLQNKKLRTNYTG
jgi:hypothetical protein